MNAEQLDALPPFSVICIPENDWHWKKADNGNWYPFAPAPHREDGWTSGQMIELAYAAGLTYQCIWVAGQVDDGKFLEVLRDLGYELRKLPQT